MLIPFSSLYMGSWHNSILTHVFASANLPLNHYQIRAPNHSYFHNQELTVALKLLLNLILSHTHMFCSNQPFRTNLKPQTIPPALSQVQNMPLLFLCQFKSHPSFRNKFSILYSQVSLHSDLKHWLQIPGG